MHKKVVIVGGGEVGRHLADLLLAWGHLPVVVEHSPAAAAQFQSNDGIPVVVGDGTDPQVLESAGIRAAEIVAAVTGSDDVNLTVASLARFQFRTARTLARVNVPRHAWMFTPELGVDVALNQAEVLAHLIVEQATTGDMLTLLKLGGGRYSLVEAVVGESSPAAGATLSSLPVPLECVIVGILRNGDVVLPRGPTVLRAGDHMIVLAHEDHCQEIRVLLEGQA